MVCANHLSQIFGIETGGQLRRADEIAQHHRQLPPLGLHRRSRNTNIG
jgi:hypothetical protein